MVLVSSRSSKRTKKKKSSQQVNFEVYKRGSYDIESEVLAAFDVEGKKQYYAGRILDFDSSTALYTVGYLDGNTNDVTVKDILCEGWFRKGMRVYASRVDCTVPYLAKVTATNYYDQDGDMIEAGDGDCLDGLDESPQIDVDFVNDGVVEIDIDIWSAFILLE